MVKKLFEIIDEANELRGKVHRAAEIKKETKADEIVGWADQTLQLVSDLAKKVDELFERLVRLEDETRKKGARAEAVPLYQTAKKKARRRRKPHW